MARSRCTALLPVILALCSAGYFSRSGEAQEPAEPSAEPTRLVIETIRKWHETELALSREKAAWEEEKAAMEDFLSLYQQELEALEGLVRSAGESATEAEEKRAELVAEERRLKEAAAHVARVLGGLEAGLLRLTPLFPKPLREEIAAPERRLREASGETRLQDRVRDLLAILLEADKFQRKVHIDREVRRMEDRSELEVTVIYLGLSRAFYVDESNRYSGVGYPAPGGWQWERRENLADEVAAAIEILETSPEKARYLDLPLQVKSIENP